MFKTNHIIKLSEIKSTNSYISDNIKEFNNGSLVWASFQTGGRGNGSNSWESEKDQNLTFSILLLPNFLKAAEQFYLSKILSLAVADYISLFTDNVSVKWPNDVYVGDNKIAGILIENSISGEFITDSIVGIGVNINQTEFRSNAPNPISLRAITGIFYDLDEQIETIHEIIAYRYQLLQNREFNLIDQIYLELLYRKDVLGEYVNHGERFQGTIVGVKPSGELLIRNEDNKISEFLFKEVVFV